MSIIAWVDAGRFNGSGRKLSIVRRIHDSIGRLGIGTT